MRPIIIAIDGPAGAGKSTVSKRLAARLGFTLVDTGAIYRCVALRAQRQGVAADDDAGLERLLESLEVRFETHGAENRVFLDGEVVSEAIRAPDISLLASRVSSRPVVRAGLLELQRRLALAAGQGAILEGRDIGTVVFPEADVKIFLSADPVERARRRQAELHARGLDTPLDQVLADQVRRDKEDSEREVAPLKAAADAVHVDSTALGLEAVVEQIAALAGRVPAR